MNLDGMLKEGSLTDLSWLENGMKNPGEITFNPFEGHKDNNIKHEAQEQWGYSDISPIFDENSGEVLRNIPEKDLGDAAPVVVFARHLMNQGATASVVDRELKARFTRDEMHKGLRGLKQLFAMDGIIGRVVVDARGYDSCEDAVKAAAKSPYKRHLKYVMGCSCGDPQMIPVADEKQEIVASTGNAMDDFFADEKVHQVKMTPHCRSTMMPICSSTDGIDPTWTDKLLTVMENVSGLPVDTAKRIREMDDKPIKKIQMAFKMIDHMKAQAARSRYSDPVNASEHVIETAENEIEIMAAPMGDIDVDPVNHAIQHEVVPEPIPELVQASVDMTAEMTEIELAAAAEAQLDGIELSEAGEISLAEKKAAVRPLEVDATAGDNIGAEFPAVLTEAFIDMTPESGGIFTGSDVIELEPERVAKSELEVDMNTKFEW